MHKKVIEFDVFLDRFVLCRKNVVADPHCFFEMFHLQQNKGILYSQSYNDSWSAYGELSQRISDLFDQKKVSFKLF